MAKFPPVRNINELAKEFGLTARQLGGIMGHDKNAPKPVLTKGSTVFKGFGENAKRKTVKNQFDYAKAKAWWNSRNSEV
jgi:hypothetical protein